MAACALRRAVFQVGYTDQPGLKYRNR